jgi:hypothetical protein
MGYCTTENVKNVLQIDIAETKHDAQIEDCIASAGGLVDGLLTPKELIVPAMIPQLISDATKYFAAWMLRRVADPVGAVAFWDEANSFLNAYIDAEFQPYVGSA